ncbi:uncharacterized protein [Branchiostoma lanceolatum]|uniref:uncharacterized protein isoform X1 n=1 Tax=Branchiostoma lanceolatum TaxID=7740 RepID=UPI0034557BB5
MSRGLALVVLLGLVGAISAQSYKGCYKRKWGTFRTHETSDDMTNQKCVAVCKKEGLPYAGTYGPKCGCESAEKFERLDKMDDSDCTTSCGGDVTQKCGEGNGRLTVWTTVEGSCGLSAFNHVPQTGCAPGDDLANPPGVTLQGCADACCVDSRCLSFQYNTYGQCYLKSKLCSAGEKHSVSAGNMYDWIDLPAAKKWRDDKRCGQGWPAEDGSPAECDPSGKYPCCSPANWCGNTANHCDCPDCVDYSDKGKREMTAEEDVEEERRGLETQSYKGCYKRKWGTFRTQATSDDMTNQKCVDICAKEGLPYAATYETKCGCESAEKFARLSPADESECFSACGGDATQKCGQANGRLSVWTTGNGKREMAEGMEEVKEHLRELIAKLSSAAEE